jgi:hypothetical protein
MTDATQTFEQVATGLTVYEDPTPVVGRAKWLETPADVIAFIENEPHPEEVIVLARGGTTTFLTLALNAGVKGVVTLQGAPESHLGIVCREYGIPCVMSASFDKGVRTARGEVIPADGVMLSLDVSSRPTGIVSVEESAPVDDSPVAEAAGMPPEMLEQIMALLANFQTVVPHGEEGDAIMQSRLTTDVLQLTRENLDRRLTPLEVNEFLQYLTWNEWDALAARATEGESGLIPRQEYEALGIMGCWYRYPEWLAAVEAKVGADGLRAIGARAKSEIGTKINLLHVWACASAPFFGRGIAIELGLTDANAQADRAIDVLQGVRRIYDGLWGGGATFTSMRGFRAEVLERSWIDRFQADRIALADEESRNTFQLFNASTELLGFLLHFDNRLGLGDSGPYPTDDGGFVILRDIFINEKAFSWSDETEGLPYAVSIALFFDKDTALKVNVTDLSNVFTEPANYLPYVTGVAMYTREKYDTPMSELKTLSLADASTLRSSIEEKASNLYRRIAGMSTRDKVVAGAVVYTAGFLLPIVRAAGLYDEFVATKGFLELHPTVESQYDVVVGGVATEMIPRLFLTGSWGNPVPLPLAHEDLWVAHALKVKGIATADSVAEFTGQSPDDVASALGRLAESGKAKELSGRVNGWTLTPEGSGSHSVTLRELRSGNAELEAAYDGFLPVNETFKQVCIDAQKGADVSAAFESVHTGVTALLADASSSNSWISGYQSRLESAAARVRAGVEGALYTPLAGSYHDVWMELHQDLLLTLGRERGEADGS